MAVTESRSGWVSPTLRAVDADAGYVDARRTVAEDSALPGDPLADEPKWPAWKVTVAVVVFSGAFWAGVYWIGSAIWQMVG